jgi:Tol biopolymer transport system component
MKVLLPLILIIVLSGPSVTVTKLTSGIILPQRLDIYHAWSPDGSRVAFLSGSSQTDQVEDHVLKVIKSDGSNPQTLTATEIFRGVVVKRVSWSPDGSRISFEVTDDTFSKIYLINPDGSGLMSPSIPRPNPGENEAPIRDEDHAWSADGSKIVFMGNGNIWVMDADGGNQHEIAHTAGSAADPTWSADGTHIAYSFSVSDLGPWEIFTMKADGSEETRLTSRPLELNANYPIMEP